MIIENLKLFENTCLKVVLHNIITLDSFLILNLLLNKCILFKVFRKTFKKPYINILIQFNFFIYTYTKQLTYII